MQRTTTTLQPFYSFLDFVQDYPMSRCQKGKTKTNLDFLEQETVSSSGISWAICKSAPRPSLFFTGRMPFLPPNQ